MKILHTADWHIGKKLHKYDLLPDFYLFTDWLCQVIESRKIDLLLISGDIFDLANPASEARRAYYQALRRLRRQNCRVIITGGNHDSPAVLNAPGDILRELDIHIIGGLPEDPAELLVPMAMSDEPELIVAAVPYLRDSDLRTSSDGNTYEERLAATRQGIRRVFQDVWQTSARHYPGVPVLAMGHLFTAGVETSESEREIQLGNQAAFDSSGFGEDFSYIALGHIHRPQRVSAAVPAFYSGSPIPLSFSERSDQKRVLLLDTEKGWEPESIPVPAFRSLRKISGSLEQLQQSLGKLSEPGQLESLLEVVLTEPRYNAQQLFEFDELVSRFSMPGYRIVKHRASFENRPQGLEDTSETSQSLEDLSPKEVFLELLSTQEMEVQTKDQVIHAFDLLMEEVLQEHTKSTSL